MSSVPRLPSAPGLRLALPLWTGGGGRPPLRRRAALGIGMLAAAAIAALVATGTTGPAGSAAPGAGVRGAPRVAAIGAEKGRARAQLQGPRASEAPPASSRVVAPTHAAALFARHSWYVAPPPKPPPPPPPPPEPRAPPLPYTFVGSFAPAGDPPVFFLKRGDRVIDAHVGDRLDGIYQLESAAGGQLVFVYLPLNVRQALAAGAPH